MPSSIRITLPPSPPITTVVTQPINQPLHIHGTVSGSYTGNGLVVDAGINDHLTGSADLKGLGWFGLTGGIQGVGMIAQGHATGELVLANAHGTITIALHGPLQSGFSSLPSQLHYTITGGTGDFQHLSGSGRVELTVIPAPIAFGRPAQGNFSLKFS
jgi:hypothetical protein